MRYAVKKRKITILFLVKILTSVLRRCIVNLSINDKKLDFKGECAMKEEAIKKVNKLGKIGHIVTKVMKILVLIGAIGVLIGCIVCAVLPKDLLSVNVSGNATVKVDLTGLDVKLDSESQAKIAKDVSEEFEFTFENGVYSSESANINEDGFEIKASGDIGGLNMRTIAYVLICIFVLLVCTYIVLIFINRVFVAFRTCQSPFEENIIKCMKNFAIALIPWSIVSCIIENCITGIFTGNIDLTIDLSVILVVLIIFALINIFKYGAMLQQESDGNL